MTEEEEQGVTPVTHLMSTLIIVNKSAGMTDR